MISQTNPYWFIPLRKQSVAFIAAPHLLGIKQEGMEYNESEQIAINTNDRNIFKVRKINYNIYIYICMYYHPHTHTVMKTHILALSFLINFYNNKLYSISFHGVQLKYHIHLHVFQFNCHIRSQLRPNAEVIRGTQRLVHQTNNSLLGSHWQLPPSSWTNANPTWHPQLIA